MDLYGFRSGPLSFGRIVTGLLAFVKRTDLVQFFRSEVSVT